MRGILQHAVSVMNSTADPSELPQSDALPSQLYDLPSPPPAFVGDDRRQGVPADLLLLSGERLRGAVLQFDGPSRDIALRIESGIRHVSFDDLRVMRLRESLPLDEANESVLPLSVEVRFKDDQRTRLESLGYSRNPFGLSVFVPAGPRRAGFRTFIPQGAIKKLGIGKPLGSVLIEQGRLSAADLSEALDSQAGPDAWMGSEEGAKAGHRGVITGDEEAFGAARLPRRRLGEILAARGDVAKQDVQRALAEQLGIPWVDVADVALDVQLAELLPASMARELRTLPVAIRQGHLRVAMADPTNAETLHTVQFVAGQAVEVCTGDPEAIDRAITALYGSEGDDLIDEVESSFEPVTGAPYNRRGKTASGALAELSTAAADEAALGQERPVVRLVHKLLADALQRRASDIHIRPGEKSLEILYRVDGVLGTVWTLSPVVLRSLVSRIKILGGMDISEHRLPQDGRTELTKEGRRVDMRISIIPTVAGESVVIRLLDGTVNMMAISELGFPPQDEVAFRDMIAKTHGLLLVTGPTGSGKSTTLYAAVREIMGRGPNIITVEDPVEYHIDGVTQIQVNHVTGLTFARALRNILRHDPDVIMIGEIRDEETAHIAIEAAMTGHLVLSTLHTNSAAGSVARLVEMNLPVYLLNTSLLGVIAQRLVRRNCQFCLEEEAVDDHVREQMGVKADEKFYVGAGCAKCSGRGFKGRLGVYELLAVSDHVRSVLAHDQTASAVQRAAVEDGMTLLTRNALQRAREKLIPLREVYRIRLE